MAAAVLTAAVTRVIDQYKLFGKFALLHSSNFLAGVAIAAAVIILGNTIGDLLVERSTFAGEGRRLDIHKAALGAIVILASRTRLPVTDLGANVFLVSSSRYSSPKLERIERIRLTDYPAASTVIWTEGKGLIGQCWQNKRPEHVNWCRTAKRWADKQISDSQWSNISSAAKQGFSKEDFLSMVGKYAEILAVPITEVGGRFVGCLAFDRIWRPDAPEQDLLNSGEIRELATGAATVLQTVLAKR